MVFPSLPSRLSPTKLLLACTLGASCVAAAGCPSAPRDPAPGFTVATGEGNFTHRGSGFSFPPRVDTFVRERAHAYDTAGRDVSVGYNDITLGPIAATVYVYPTKGQSLEQEFALRQTEVTSHHGGVTLLSAGPIQVSPRRVGALSASYSYTDLFARATQPLRSELVVAPYGGFFVEYRFTYPAAAVSVDERVRSFEDTFAWP